MFQKFYDLKLKYEQQCREDEENRLRNQHDVLRNNQHRPVSRDDSSPTLSLSAKDNFGPHASAPKAVSARKGGNAGSGVSIKDKVRPKTQFMGNS